MFQVLGPVAASVDGEPLNIGGLKQRTVLAMLLARRPQRVSVEVLAQAVYGDELPDRRRRRIQTYVSTLRSVVGELITKDGDGWSVSVSDDHVDAARFEALYESSIGCEPDTAASLLGEALSLWRGVPYAEVEAHGELDAEISRLSELRVTVLHARIDADLESGRHAETVGELEWLIGEHPYHEQFRAQHALALYRSGRQRDALRSFAVLRERLVDELGVDPSPELQQLEARILAQDESLLASRPLTARMRPGRPATSSNLPKPPSALVGRQAEISRVASLLDSCPLVTLTGVGGCGKTRLAIEVGWHLFDDYPDGVSFADLSVIGSDDEVIAVVASSIGVGAGGGEPLTRVTEYLADKRALVVLDNCEHVLEGCADFVEATLQHAAEWRVVATSREALHVDGEQLYAVPPLSVERDEAVELFRIRARALDPDFSLDDGNREVVHELCERLDRMPLAIELAAARTTVMSPAELLGRIDDRFDVLSGGRQRKRNRTRTLEATLEWSYDLLEVAEQQLFSDLGVFAGPFEPSELASVGQLDLSEAIDVADSLVAKSLVVATRVGGSTRLHLLETVRAYAVGKSSAGGRLEAARDRHLAHYVEVSHRDDTALLDVSAANVDIAIDWAIATERWRDAAQLVIAEGHMWHQSDYFPAWGHLRGARSKLDRLDAIVAGVGVKTELGERLGMAEAQLSLADYDEERVLASARRSIDAQLPDVRFWGIAVTANFLAMTDPAESLRLLDAGAELSPDNFWPALIRGYVHALSGDYDAALPELQQIPSVRARWHDANVAAMLLLTGRPGEALAVVERHPAAGSCWNAYLLIAGLAKLALGRRDEAEVELLNAARGATDGKIPFVANTSLIGLAALLADEGELVWAAEILLGAPSQRLACLNCVARGVAEQAGVLDELIERQGPARLAKARDRTVLLRTTLERWDDRHRDDESAPDDC